MKATTLLILLVGANIILSQPTNNNQTFFTGGGCATIPDIGSPILMVSNVHDYIEDGLNTKNKYTVVKYIHFVQTASSNSPNRKTYKIAFSITDYNSTKYVGIEVIVAPNGIGSTRINKFILTNSVEKLKKIIDSTIDPDNTYSCGDLKFAYSSYGKGGSKNLDYIFPGQNQNRASDSILSKFGKSSSQEPSSKTCVTSNYLETDDFIGSATANTPVDLLQCISDKKAVAAIRIGCVSDVLTMIQLVFNNIGNNGTTNSNIVGSSSTSVSDISTIDISDAFRVEFESATNGTQLTFSVTTYDNNNVIQDQIQCGTATANPSNVIVLASDFLGLTSIYSDGSIIEGFEITQYKE